MFNSNDKKFYCFHQSTQMRLNILVDSPYLFMENHKTHITIL